MASSFFSSLQTVCLMLCSVLIKLAMPEVSIAFPMFVFILHSCNLEVCAFVQPGQLDFFFWIAQRGYGSSSNNHRSVEHGSKQRNFTSFRKFPLAATSMEGKAEFAISLARMSNMNLHIPINILLTCHSRCIYTLFAGHTRYWYTSKEAYKNIHHIYKHYNHLQ